ncbi:MAG: type IV pilus assembly protein PilM [Amnibacterium sp.]
MSKNLIGIDFGHGVIRAAEVAPGKRRPVVHRYHEVPVSTDAVKEGVVVDRDVVVQALRRLWAEAKFTTKNVVIGMGSQQVLIRELVVPKMSAAHIRETLPFRVQDLLPLPVEDAVLDFFPIEEIDADGTPGLRGLLVAATRESVLANAMAAEAAGLRTVDVDLIPFAVSRTSATHAAGTTEVLLHVGAVSTSIIIAEGGVPQFIRVLPSGGAELTTALAERMGVDVAQAEEVKRRVGLLPDPRDPESPMVARVNRESADELIQAVRSTIAFYRHSHAEVGVDGIVLSGGGALLRGFAEALANATDVPVSFSSAVERFALGGHVDEAQLLAAGPAPAVALGLTMRSAA